MPSTKILLKCPYKIKCAAKNSFEEDICCQKFMAYNVNGPLNSCMHNSKAAIFLKNEHRSYTKASFHLCKENCRRSPKNLKSHLRLHCSNS